MSSAVPSVLIPPPSDSVSGNQLPREATSFVEYRDAARELLMRECCVNWDRLQHAHQTSALNGFVCIHLATRGRFNLLGVYNGPSGSSGKRLFKHVFLQNRVFRNEVVQYYKKLGYDWVDVVVLNRVDWKIFLWYTPKPGEEPVGVPPVEMTSAGAADGPGAGWQIEFPGGSEWPAPDRRSVRSAGPGPPSLSRARWP